VEGGEPTKRSGPASFSVRTLSRIGGGLYVVIIVLGAVQEIAVRQSVIVEDDAASTARNLDRLESLWRMGIAAEFVLLSCAIGLALILFVLLRPVDRGIALLAMLFNVVSIAIEGAAALYLMAALIGVDNGVTWQALAIEVHSYGFAAALIFFGIECIILGYLIFKSWFLPRALGVLMAIAGVCYLSNSYAMTIAPDFAARLLPAILVPPFVGEASLALWLLIRGIDPKKWPLAADPTPCPLVS
jgi:uncharacterized protein DUF4386